MLAYTMEEIAEELKKKNSVEILAHQAIRETAV